MSFVKSKGYKKTKTYKKIRQILVENEMEPEFCDNLENGVSFKWHPRGKSILFLEDNIKKIFPSDLLYLIKVKFLDCHGKTIKIEKDWIEEIFGKRAIHNAASIRMLVNLKEVE